MLSLYEEFPDDVTIKRLLNGTEAEIQFIPSEAPQKREFANPYADAGTEINTMLTNGVACKRFPDGEARIGVIHLSYPEVRYTENGRTVTDPREVADLQPFVVHRARGEYTFSELRQEPYFDIWELLPAVPDPELEEIAAKAAEPVVLSTAHGLLTLDRQFNDFDGHVDQLGIQVSIGYDGDGLLLAEDKTVPRKFTSGLKFVDTVLSVEYLDSARRFAAEKVLREANRWRHDVAEAEERPTPAPELSVDDVYAKLSATSVFVPQRGNIKVEFDDGYMFGGHPVTVNTKRDGTPTSIER